MKMKYGNKKVIVDGIKFDSKKEANRFKELLILEQAGKISQLSLQPEFELQEKFKYHGQSVRSIKYRGDFKYLDEVSDTWMIEDTKGFETPEFKIKWKIVKFKYPEYIFIKS